jgi:anaerobic ribonucleoside-triphosphate reductase activating protein
VRPPAGCGLTVEPGAAPEAGLLRVGGVTPFTSIDCPGKLSAVVYVQGCPWRCRYCHNLALQSRQAPPDARAWSDVLAWLRRRVGLIDAVVFSGGEPTLDPGLGAAIAQVRSIGLDVGLHTAGISPRRLREVLPWIDWVGVDVKAPLDHGERYDAITGRPGSAAAVRDSVGDVLRRGVACEFRTTAHPALLGDDDLIVLAQDLARRGATHYALQLYRSAGGAGPTLPPVGADYPRSDTLARLTDLFARFTLRRG